MSTLLIELVVSIVFCLMCVGVLALVGRSQSYRASLSGLFVIFLLFLTAAAFVHFFVPPSGNTIESNWPNLIHQLQNR